MVHFSQSKSAAAKKSQFKEGSKNVLRIWIHCAGAPGPARPDLPGGDPVVRRRDRRDRNEVRRRRRRRRRRAGANIPGRNGRHTGRGA